MLRQSIITETKIDLLRCGVKFSPIDLFTNYENINLYKIKKIKVQPTIINDEVYDVSEEENIFPSEIEISLNERKSISKLRYDPESTVSIKLTDGILSLYKNNKKIDVKVDFVDKISILNNDTPIQIDGEITYVGDFVDVVGIDRISILFFEGCYNWNCGKACKFCDLHPKTVLAKSIKPTVNKLKTYDFHISDWWNKYKDDYFKGIKFSIKKILKNCDLEHKHLFFMSGNLPDIGSVWEIAEELLNDMCQYLDLSSFDTYLNIAPHDTIDRIKRIKSMGIRQVQYNLEIANKELFEDVCPGKMKYDDFVFKLKEAVSVFGVGNVRSNFVFGLQDKDELLKEIEKLASYGIVADYSVFQPKNNTPFYDKKAPNLDDVIHFSNALVDIYLKYNFHPIFCSLSSRSSIINEIYEDRIQ